MYPTYPTCLMLIPQAQLQATEKQLFVLKYGNITRHCYIERVPDELLYHIVTFTTAVATVIDCSSVLIESASLLLSIGAVVWFIGIPIINMLTNASYSNVK